MRAAQARTATVRARIEPRLKHDVEDVLDQLGFSTSQAIEIFFRQVKLNQGMPFDVRIPNETTLKTFRDSENGKNLIRYKTAKDMFKDLGL